MANLISYSRIVAGLAVCLAALAGATSVALGCLAYALVSDAVDGWVARALGTVTEYGARLDSAADCVIYLTMPFVAWALLPVVRERATVSCVLMFLAYALPVGYGFAKYGRLTSYHTIAAKASGAFLSIAFFVLLVTGVAWPLHLAVSLLVLSALEELAITRVLPDWRADVKSLYTLRREHVRRGALAVPTGQ